jgi:hypothetical protein
MEDQVGVDHELSILGRQSPSVRTFAS